MKKIFSLIFVVLMLISAVVPVFATESIKEIETVDSILVNSAREDLELVYGDKLDTEYPKNSKDNSVYLITIREYKPKDIVENIYFYFYNPSEKEIKDSDYNKVLMANMFDSNYNPTGYTKVNLKLISASDDNRFIKFCLSPVSTPKYITYNGGRHYFISGVEMESYSEKLGNNVVDYHVGYTFTFFGNGANTTCIKSKTTTLDIEVHQTSYLTGDSAKETIVEDWGSYSNQINSVYFSLPKEYEKQFGKLSSISYEYYHYRTKPILLVDDSNVDLYNSLFNRRGKEPNFEMYWAVHFDSNTYSQVNWYYGSYIGKESENHNAVYSIYYNYDYCNVYPYYTSVFQVKDISKKNKILIDDKTIQDYFANYNASNHSGKKVGSKKYSGDLFDLENSLGYSGVITKTSEDIFSMESFADSKNNNFGNMLKNLFLGKWGYVFDINKYDNAIKDAKYIEEVTENKLSGSETEISNSLFVSKGDVAELKKFYYNSDNDNEVVYLLRYGLSDDYYFSEKSRGDLEDCEKIGMFQCDVYLDFDIIQFTFSNEENITVIPVVSTPTDGFTDVENTTPEHNVGPIADTFTFIGNVLSGAWSAFDFLFDFFGGALSVLGNILKYSGPIIGFILVFLLLRWLYKMFKTFLGKRDDKKYEKDKELHGKEYADAERAKRNKKKSEKAKKNFERKKKLKGLYQKIKVKFKQYSYNRKQQKRRKHNNQKYNTLKKQSKPGKRYKESRHSSKRYNSNKR